MRSTAKLWQCLSLMLLAVIAEASPSLAYRVSPTPGFENARAGMFVYEIERDEKGSWKLTEVRGGKHIEGLLLSQESVSKLAAQNLKNHLYGEVLIVDPRYKTITLATTTEYIESTVYDSYRKPDEAVTYKCLRGFFSTSRRGRGYNICSSRLGKTTNSLFHDLFQFPVLAFGSRWTWRAVDPQLVLAAAEQAGVIEDAENRYAAQYGFIKARAQEIIAKQSGRLGSVVRDVYERNFKGLPPSAASRGIQKPAELDALFSEAATISGREFNAAARANQLKNYRQDFESLNDYLDTTAYHDIFIFQYRNNDPEGLVPIVERRLAALKQRIAQSVGATGQKVCFENDAVKIVGFVEQSTTDKLQIRVADILLYSAGYTLPKDAVRFHDITVERGHLIWESYPGWRRCL